MIHLKRSTFTKMKFLIFVKVENFRQFEKMVMLEELINSENLVKDKSIVSFEDEDPYFLGTFNIILIGFTIVGFMLGY